jgi:hypothetical protein
VPTTCSRELTATKTLIAWRRSRRARSEHRLKERLGRVVLPKFLERSAQAG